MVLRPSAGSPDRPPPVRPFTDSCEQVGCVTFERGEDILGGEQEDARVSKEITSLQHFLGARGIGLFDKAAERNRLTPPVRALADFEIAMAISARGLDAERDHPPLRDDGLPLAYRLMEGGLVGDDYGRTVPPACLLRTWQRDRQRLRELGVPAESVAKRAMGWMLGFLESRAFVDPYLADPPLLCAGKWRKAHDRQAKPA